MSVFHAQERHKAPVASSTWWALFGLGLLGSVAYYLALAWLALWLAGQAFGS